MRRLAQPRVLISAGIAALITGLACYPRLFLWLHRSDPVWYLEAVIFLCSIVLWGFVFAWHTPYTHRPLLTLKVGSKPFIAVTLAGIVVALAFRLLLDPALRLKTPEEYPADLKQWLSLVLFSLTFSQLFLVFAPFAWLMRLFQNRWVATFLTVLFGAVVLAIKIRSFPTPLSPPLFAAILAGRTAMGFLSLSIYWRGGLILNWWWTLLVEARYLLDLAGSP